MNHALVLVQFAFHLGIFFTVLTTPAYAHGGGLDAYGCHHNRKTGGYHCHRGPFAGEAFNSKAEMLDRLKATNGEKPNPPNKPSKLKT
jgi:hypothetical protein